MSLQHAGLTVRPFIQALENRKLLAAGQLDPSCIGGGIASVDFGTFRGSSRATALAIGSGGKIIVVGNDTGVFSSDAFGIARFNSNGTLDSSFNGDGKQSVGFDDDAYAN